MKKITYLNQLFNALAKRYGFIPIILKEIIILRLRGYNNSKIAEMLGISRNTVASYLSKLQKIESPDFLRLILYMILAEGGFFFLPEEIKSESSEIYAG